MKIRTTKAAGSFDCSKPGSFELLVHMEADPNSLSYAEFDFETALPGRKARAFRNVAAYSLRHRIGRFVVCAEPEAAGRPVWWNELDASLARRGIWLFAATCEELRREPLWSNALDIARCARADIAPADRETIVAHLDQAGRASLRDCMKLCTSSLDSYDAVLSLVSSGTVHLDLSQDLSPGIQLYPLPVEAPLGWLPS